MKVRATLIIAVVCLIQFGVLFPASAAWIENGVPLCIETGNQMSQSMIPDGEGGAFIVWEDYRNGISDIYAQRVDQYGNELWTPGGLPVCTAVGTQAAPDLVSDGEDGIIIAWYDTRTGGVDIYAQRVDGSGVIQWGDDEVPACEYYTSQGSPLMVSDGSGGAILAWSENRVNNYDIIATRIDDTGKPVWSEEGVQICTANLYQYLDDIVSDGEGGAVIVWHDYRSGVDFDIYAQRVLADSTKSWTADGRSICTATGGQSEAQIIRDISGAYILAWKDSRSGNNDIYAQQITYSGSSQWTYNGIVICDATGYQENVNLVSDGEWGAIVVWADRRSSPTEIMAQKVTAMGNILWTVNGIQVAGTTGGSKSGPRSVSDGEGGVIVVWEDYRSGTNSNVYGERIDSNGNADWDATGVPLRIESGSVNDNLSAVPDGTGGVIASWPDQRYGNRDMFCQRVERFGEWGYPSAEIYEVTDVPGDEGGFINISWYASRLDPWPIEEISNYTIWRAITESSALALQKSGAEVLPAGALPVPDDDGKVLRMEESAAGLFFWELVATVDAVKFESYSATVPSLFDSTDVSPDQTYFQIVTTGWSLKHWISHVDSGYSVDNLAPAAPLGLAGEQVFGPDGLQLTWDPNTEPDLAEYKIYRGTSSGFVPGPGNFVTSTPDTASLDGGWDWATGYWYKVSAVDIHGNESIFAVLGPDLVTGDDPMPLPDATFLAQNYPNPFNPNTTIAFGLKSGGFVNLSVYDAAGRLVATLINESRPAGQYATVWNGNTENGSSAASGVYFYKLVTEEFAKTRKMILLR